jgi:N-acetylglutamate synthase-like GNAT family acetyltransferase
MTFRNYQASDKEKCLELFRSNTPKFFAPHEETEFASYLEHPHYYFVLEQEGQLLGCGGYGISNHQGYLAWGMVKQSQHSTGLGKRLLLERLNLIAQHQDVTKILLDTSQHTFGFFEKLGFVTQTVTEDGYASGLHRYDMELGLDKGSRNIIQEKLTSLLGAKGFADSVVNNQKEND